MKKLIYGVSFLALLGIIVVGCQKENVSNSDGSSQLSNEQSSFKDINLIKKDKIFIDLMEQTVSVAAHVKDLKKITEITSKTSLENNDVEILANELGFDNPEKLYNYLEKLKKSIRVLDNTYNLSSYDDAIITNLALESNYPRLAKEFNFGNKDNQCERIRRNCIIIAGAGAVLGHLGCLTVDIVGVGVICHGAVIAGQIAASDNCNAEAAQCQQGGK